MNVSQRTDDLRPTSALNARANSGADGQPQRVGASEARPSTIHCTPALYPPPEAGSHEGSAAAIDAANNGMRRGLGGSWHPLRSLRRQLRERQAYLMLSALDDSLLKDIGIGRSEILYHARLVHGEQMPMPHQGAIGVGDDHNPYAWTAGRVIVAALLVLGGVVAMLGYDAALKGVHAPTVSLATLLAILLAATCSSVAGFAFSALCGAILFHTIGTPVMAVQIMLLCSVAVQGVSVAALRNEIDIRSLGQLLAGGMVGLPIGVYALLHLGRGAFGAVFGAILIAYGTYRVCRPSLRQVGNSALGNVLAGMVGGVTGGLAAFPGALVTVWCGLKGWSPARQRGVYQPYILIMQVLTIAALATASPRAEPFPMLDPAVVAYVPAAVTGTLIGLWFFHRISNRHFTVVANLLLIAAGVGMEV